MKSTPLDDNPNPMHGDAEHIDDAAGGSVSDSHQGGFTGASDLTGEGSKKVDFDMGSRTQQSGTVFEEDVENLTVLRW